MVPDTRFERPKSFNDMVCRLIDLGYYVVPIPAGCKGPTIKNWQVLHMTKQNVPHYFNQPDMLVGVLHKNTCFIDVDVYDPELAARIADEAKRRWPDCLERVGQAPKTALVLGMDEPGFRIPNTIKGEKDGVTAQVEIRSVTRQAVVYGKHPDTHKFYEWPGRDLWETPWADLPRPTQADMQDFRDWAQDVIFNWSDHAELNAKPTAQIFDYGVSAQFKEEKATQEQLKEALSYVPANCDYDTWVQVLMGLHDYYDGGHTGLLVAQTWSSAYPNYSAKEVATKWRSFEVGKGSTYLTIFHHAKQNGADLSAIARMGKPEIVTPTNGPMVTPLPQPGPSIILPPLQFESLDHRLQNMTPPKYVVDGVIAEGYCLSLTGFAGSGKTSLITHMATQVATGDPFGGCDCEQGATLILAGENPTNVDYQFAAALATRDLNAAQLPIHILAGHVPLSLMLDQLIRQASEIENLKLIIVDSLQSFFEGDDENNNAEQLEAARRFRRLTELPSRPAVVIIAHPAGKVPNEETLVPRGGSAFLNEIDGNLTLWSEADGVQTLHHSPKFRGVPFEPINFVLEERTFDTIKDAKDRPMTIPVCRQQLQLEAVNAAHNAERRDRDALMIIDSNPHVSLRSLGEHLRVSKTTASRVMKNLKDEKLIRRRAKKWELTTDGREVANGE